MTDPKNIASWWKSLTIGQRATARRVAMSGSRKLDNDTFDSLVTHGNPMAAAWWTPVQGGPDAFGMDESIVEVIQSIDTRHHLAVSPPATLEDARADAARYFKHDDFEWVEESGGTGGLRRVTYRERQQGDK